TSWTLSRDRCPRIAAWHKSAAVLDPQTGHYAIPPAPARVQHQTVYWPVPAAEPDACPQSHHVIRLELLDASSSDGSQSPLRRDACPRWLPEAAGRRLLAAVALGIVRVRALGVLFRERGRFSHNSPSSLAGLDCPFPVGVLAF